MLQGKSVTLTTYGLGRTERPPKEDVRVDCRPIRNPHGVRGDADAIMLQSPGFPVVIGLAMENVLKHLRTHDSVSVGVCCQFGQHRSPLVAQVLQQLLTALGVEVQAPRHLAKEADTLYGLHPPLDLSAPSAATVALGAAGGRPDGAL